jgi:xylulokinase
LALRAESGAGGLVLLPYLDGERTPNLPDARGSLHGITRENFTKENLARAVVEGMLCGLADAVDALSAQGLQVNRVLLIGGAASSPAVQQIAATIFSANIVVPMADEYVAVGAARQAAWAVLGGEAPPAWPAIPAPASAAALPQSVSSHPQPGSQTAAAPVLPANPNPQVRANYASARNALHQ